MNAAAASSCSCRKRSSRSKAWERSAARLWKRYVVNDPSRVAATPMRPVRKAFTSVVDHSLRLRWGRAGKHPSGAM
jgi:hypothetical protein